MRSKVLEIHFRSLNDFEKEIKHAVDRREKLIQPKHHLYFDSVASFRNFMTIQKLELLTAISCQKPTSIYELAKLVERDFAGVQRDCVGLEGNGFIRLMATKSGRKSKRPLLTFPYSTIAIYIPKSPYQLHFEEAA